ncbi:hypothetical protein EH31_11645 [Erythrobacter longus]|uniref:Uncharacterized protein n=1 Tax=Erythrobacter longus TaxID=1044 RepID=A0A074M8P9_ERYLO|nr:hypothetical protein [Erythrobacter longus]KEO89799.1 hypothetical protein EH31_11645 [Erythrobacter longus]
MRFLLLGLGLVVLMTLLALFWQQDERFLDSYAGVETGMTLRQADKILDANDWTRLAERNPGRMRLLCGSGRAVVFVARAEIGAELVLHTDEDCTVSKIVKRRRGLGS